MHSTIHRSVWTSMYSIICNSWGITF